MGGEEMSVESVAAQEWAVRNSHWERAPRQIGIRKADRARRRAPLILCGHGVSLTVDKGTLLIRDGATHYPQERQTHRLFRGALDLPSRIMVIDGTGSITFDVLDWLAEQSIPLVRLTWRGEVVSVIGGAAFAGNPARVEWQRETRLDPERRVSFAAELIARKLESSLETLRWAIEPSRTREIAEHQAATGIRSLRGGGISTVDQVRILEARAAAAYFSAWRALPIHWGQRSKHPVPADWSRARGRASTRGGFAQGNRHATHPVNAMLNYAYGALESRVHIAAASSGFDPKQGILHHDRDDALAFVYDMMEPERPKVDRAVLGFIDATTFTGADFVLRSDGVCRVAPQLARRLCQLVIG